MANTPFKKNRAITIPVSTSNGGTGRKSLPANSVLVGAGVGNIHSISPGVSGNGLVSNGLDWENKKIPPANGSVTYSKLASDLVGSSNIDSVNIDFSSSSIFTKNLTSSTSFTFSNLQLNKTITLIIKGNYPLIFPATVRKITGEYDGWATNYITLHCTKLNSPTEIWAVLNKKNYNTPVGYFSGGASASYSVTTDRIIFPTGVNSANTVSNLSQARYGLSGVSDGSTYGYFAGGTNGSYLATAERIVFATTVTSASTISNLSTPKGFYASISDASLYGYFIGGYVGYVIGNTDRVVYSTSVTSANATSDLTQVASRQGAVSDSVSYGYITGGINGAGTSIALAERINFSTGVFSANTISNLSTSKFYHSGLSSSVYGYFAGGATTGTVRVATVDRIVFSTGVTSANTISSLAQARYGLTGVSDGTSYGYFAGGTTGAYVATTERISFSTEAFLTSTAASLSQGRGYSAGISNCAV